MAVELKRGVVRIQWETPTAIDTRYSTLLKTQGSRHSAEVRRPSHQLLVRSAGQAVRKVWEFLSISGIPRVGHF